LIDIATPWLPLGTDHQGPEQRRRAGHRQAAGFFAGYALFGPKGHAFPALSHPRYEEISADRRGRLEPSAAAARDVFEKAYDIAMQIATSPTAKTLQRIAEALDAEVRLVARTA
jgi:hypothetical protein